MRTDVGADFIGYCTIFFMDAARNETAMEEPPMLCGLPAKEVANTVNRLRKLGVQNFLAGDSKRNGVWTDTHDGAKLYYVGGKLNGSMHILQQTNAVARVMADVNAGAAHFLPCQTNSCQPNLSSDLPILTCLLGC